MKMTCGGEIERLPFDRSVKEKAASIYSEAYGRRLHHGRSLVVLAAASLYAACRITGAPLSLREVSKSIGVSEREVLRCYGVLVDRLDLRIPPRDPADYIPRVAGRLGVSSRTQKLATEIIREAKRSIDRSISLSGRNPRGLAAAALYVACLRLGEKRSQQEVADAADLSVPTVRNVCKLIKRSVIDRDEIVVKKEGEVVEID